jgi:hypothetical protein
MTFQSQRDQYASRLTKMLRILRQPKVLNPDRSIGANFATAKFGFKIPAFSVGTSACANFELINLFRRHMVFDQQRLFFCY